VWQNLLLSDIPEDRIPVVQQELEGLGLHWKATHVRGALVACTGNAGIWTARAGQAAYKL
jgi:ferredoxin-nitrite reductase